MQIKNILFWKNRYILDENQLLEAVEKNSYYVPMYEKINVYFQGFWPQVHNICRVGFFRIAIFSEHLLPIPCEYSMLLPLSKIKSQNIKDIGDKKPV